MNMKLPKGVEIHKGRVRISFSLDGKRHREIIRDMPVNEKTIDYARSVRELVLDEINRGVFDYQRRFPDSTWVVRIALPEQRSSFDHLPTCQPIATAPQESKPGTMTVTEGVLLWLGIMKGETAPTTYTNYRCKAGHVMRHFGDTPIDKVTIQDLKLFRIRLVKPENGKKGLSPKTANDVLTVLRGVWADAKANGLVSNNHMNDISNHRVKYQSTADPFTREEIDLIHQTDPERIREARLVVFNCWTGLSRSELLGLAREDIDLNENLIYIRRAFVEGEFRIPKEEHRERSVELIKPGAALLKQIIADTAHCQQQLIEVTQRDNLSSKPEKVTLLFRDWTTEKPWDTDDLDTWFAAHLREAGVRHRGINQCRHTYASQSLSSHVPLEWLAKQLGHSDTTMIKKHYGKLIPADTKRMASQVSEQMGFGEGCSGL